MSDAVAAGTNLLVDEKSVLVLLVRTRGVDRETSPGGGISPAGRSVVDRSPWPSMPTNEYLGPARCTRNRGQSRLTLSLRLKQYATGKLKGHLGAGSFRECRSMNSSAVNDSSPNDSATSKCSSSCRSEEHTS